MSLPFIFATYSFQHMSVGVGDSFRSVYVLSQFNFSLLFFVSGFRTSLTRFGCSSFTLFVLSRQSFWKKRHNICLYQCYQPGYCNKVKRKRRSRGDRLEGGPLRHLQSPPTGRITSLQGSLGLISQSSPVGAICLSHFSQFVSDGTNSVCLKKLRSHREEKNFT